MSLKQMIPKVLPLLLFIIAALPLVAQEEEYKNTLQYKIGYYGMTYLIPLIIVGTLLFFMVRAAKKSKERENKL